MKFKDLAKYFNQIEKTSSRLEITAILAELFRKINKEEIEKVSYLLQGRIAPLYEKADFGIGEKMLIKTIVSSLNLEKKLFIKEYKRIGDLGKAAEQFRQEVGTIGENDLSIFEVFNTLKKLTIITGEGSQEAKISLLSQLIKSLDSLSCRYLVRIPVNTLRLGFSDMTVLDAFSWMLKGDKSWRPQIEKAYHVRPDLGLVGRVLKTEGLAGLEKIKPAIFTPIIMMKAERLASAREIIEKIGKCAIEEKYDGFRLQAHFKKSKVKSQKLKVEEVRLYSRNLEDVTYMYPDIVDGIKKQVCADEIIFEGEAIGFDPHTGNFLPFQETVQRKRKYGIKEKAKEVPLKLFVFELLYLNNQSCLNIPFIERRRELSSVIKTSKNISKDTIFLAPEMITDEEKKLELMFDEAVSKGLEGIMAKKLQGVYQPGARGWNWIKFKRSYASKIEDTIDCLVMGYDSGRGKRSDFGIGAFLVGIYDDKEDKFVTIAKIGTGLSDKEWRQLKVQSSKFKVQKKPNHYEVDKAMECDVWITPEIVVEIRADEISRSPIHTAGRKMKPTKTGQAQEIAIPGYALRFPRLERFRYDKRPEEVTILKEVEAMFKKQGLPSGG